MDRSETDCIWVILKNVGATFFKFMANHMDKGRFCSELSLFYIYIYIYIFQLSEVPFWLVTVSAMVSSYTTSLFRDITAKPATSAGENRTATKHQGLHPLLFSNSVCMGSLTSHRELMNIEDICEMGPTVYSPYPRRLESLTICRWNYKGSNFSSVILRSWVLIQPGCEPATSHVTARCWTNRPVRFCDVTIIIIRKGIPHYHFRVLNSWLTKDFS